MLPKEASNGNPLGVKLKVGGDAKLTADLYGLPNKPAGGGGGGGRLMLWEPNEGTEAACCSLSPIEEGPL